VIIAFAIPLIPTVARVIRANTLALRELPFVEAAKSIGMSDTRIALRHVLPNTLAPLIVLATAQLRLHHPHRGLAVVPRPRHSRALSVLGPHAVGIGGGICPHRAVAGDLPRRGDQPSRCSAPICSAMRFATSSTRGSAADDRGPEADDMVLDVKNLQTVFFTNSGLFRAVDDVSFSVPPRRDAGDRRRIRLRQERQRAVGACGWCPTRPAASSAAPVTLEGTDLLGSTRPRCARSGEIGSSMIFQEPMTSLKSVMRIGDQITEVLRLHREMTSREPGRRRRDAASRPHSRAGAAGAGISASTSGGNAQRAMIAMALACRPALLIADEPTTALDVTIQAQILALIVDLQKTLGTGLILITHDLGVVAQTAQRVIVMYAGKKVEEADPSRRPVAKSEGTPTRAGLMAPMPGG
jgi:peptide/nickel transport system ATP-binding protein